MANKTIKICCRGRICIHTEAVFVLVPWPVHGHIWRTKTHNSQIIGRGRSLICGAAVLHKKQSNNLKKQLS